MISQIVRAAFAVAVILLGVMTPMVMPQSGQSTVDPSIVPSLLLSKRSQPIAFAQDDDDDNDDGDNSDDDDDDDNDDGDNSDDDDDDDNDDGDNSDDDDDDDNDDGDNSDDDNDDGDNSGDGDNSDDDDDDDNDDGDNSDDDDDDDDDNGGGLADNVQGGTAPSSGPTFDTQVLEATGTTTGGDTVIGLPGDRIVIRTFPGMPAGISLTLRILDRSAFPTASGAPVIALIFQVEARDAQGAPLVTLPAEMNVSAHYMDSELNGLNKSRATLYWFDPTTNQWGPAPKLVVDPNFNYVGASSVGAGYYCICLP